MELLGTASVQGKISKQAAIPQKANRFLGVSSGDKLLFIKNNNNEVTIQKDGGKISEAGYKGVYILGIATGQGSGQTTIPKDAALLLDISKGDKLLFIKNSNKEVVIQKNGGKISE